MGTITIVLRLKGKICEKLFFYHLLTIITIIGLIVLFNFFPIIIIYFKENTAIIL